MKITVYCGSGFGNDKELVEQVKLFGEKLAAAGDSLVYGGSATGLMDTLATAVMHAGGQVTGVQLQYFAERNLSYQGLTRMIYADTLSERKQIMIDEGDAYVALPGGAGTLDEISEIITLKNIGILKKPCVLFNWNGYYEPLIDLYDHFRDNDFMESNIRDLVYLAKNAEDILTEIHM